MNTRRSYSISLHHAGMAVALSLRRLLFCLITGTFAAVSLPGALLVRYDFDGMTNPAVNLPANPIEPVFTAEGVTADGFNAPGLTTNGVFRAASNALLANGNLGGGITRANRPEVLDDKFVFALWSQNTNGNTLQHVLDRNTEYVSFTFSLSEATTLESLTFDYWSNEANQSPDVAVFTSVVSDFSGALQASEAVQTFEPSTGAVALVNDEPAFSGTQTLVVDLSSETYANLTGEVEVRIYFYNSNFNAISGCTWISYLEVRNPGGNDPDPDPEPEPEPEPAQPPAGVAILPKSQIMEPGETFQMSARVRPDNNTDSTVSWSTGNAAIATVSSSGLVTAVSAGDTTITATSNTGNFTDTSEITVAAPLQTKGIGVIGPDGWTVLAPSTDSRLVYVSSSEGNDSNDGFSPATAKRTIAAGDFLIRNNQPDWLLLKRGDTFPSVSLGSWKSGRSGSEPVVMSYYGESGPRPVIKLTGRLIDWGGQVRNHVAFVGLDLHRAISDPYAPEFSNSGSGNAFRFVTSGHGIFI